MSNVKLPIETTREGNKITKVCVEDYHKIINRIGKAEERSSKEWNKIWDNLEKEVQTSEETCVSGCLVVGTGTSQPNISDAFDEKIGNNIAFMKAKLNANMKKRNILLNLWNAAMITVDSIDEEIEKLDNLIRMDIKSMRDNYNPEYLNHLTEYGYEI